MNSQELTAKRRALVENAPRPFRTPDVVGSSIYMLEEAAELVTALNRIARPGDLRSRPDSEKDGVPRELAQLVFMTATTATLLGVQLPHLYMEELPRGMSVMRAAMMCARTASNIALHYEDGSTDAPAAVVAMLQSVAIHARRIATELNVDLEKEINAWMDEVEIEAHASR